LTYVLTRVKNHYYPFDLKHTGYNSDEQMYAKDGSLIRIRPVPPLFTTSYHYKYNGKEYQEELGLNMYDYIARYYNPKFSIWLSVDPLAEKYPAHNPYNYCFNSPVRYVDPDGNDPTPFEAALMALHVYNNNSPLLGGWQQSYIYQYNVDGNNKIGLKCAMYERLKEDQTREYAFVFAGTEDIEKDGIEDIKQIIGKSQQYLLAATLAVNMSNYLGSDKLVFVGHSLGGGLANFASYATGRSSITFNPAWISKQTKAYVKKKDLLPGAYNVNLIHEDDPLHKMQVNNAKGIIQPMGKNIFIEGGIFSNSFTGHLMNTMIERMIINHQNTSHKGNGDDDIIHKSPRYF
jgi:RHS repeat-associated protein